MGRNREKENLANSLLFFAAAVIFVLFFSTSTSPLYGGYGADSAIFQVIGKYWAEGKVPYLELFDHKGPYIFFIDAIGYGILNSKSGIVLLQCVNLFVFLIGVYKTASCFFEKKNAMLWTMVTLGFLSLCYEGGNLTEEFVLPFLAFSAYGQLKFLTKPDLGKWGGHQYKWSFLYGITFSLCVFTRLTNAVGLCCGIFIILCILIREKEWKNIGGNILATAAGTAAAGIPFILYFLGKDALYEMFVGTIWQNVRYTVSSDAFWWSTPHSVVGWIHIAAAHFCSYGLIFAGIAAFLGKKKEEAAYYLFVGVCMTAYLVTRKAFYHYTMITVPFLPAIAAVCTDVPWAFIQRNKGKLRMVLAAFLGLFIAYQALTVVRDSWGKTGEEPEYASLLQEIPEEERNAFVAYNVRTDFYLLCDMEPCYRYFHHQDAHAAVNEGLRQNIKEEYGTAKAKWILMMETEFENSIEEILDKEYLRVAGSGKYALYHKK